MICKFTTHFYCRGIVNLQTFLTVYSIMKKVIYLIRKVNVDDM